ncbi:eggshell protein 1 isoform X2 [Medicago truncatula]|uniref:Nodule-specific Glycine Rich Peptide MtNodGRP1D n=1 Tax=Medicago truncatula TaxID=3880 RepID=A7KHH1_MEDTR|nr:eggshell protein 1 isoform X2 [Medicago truncatula]ABS31478.1 nodule-specific glycine-rich protein 1D [Medicago truncatula]AES99736.2 Nodule-specific Glycine Rich Peptide MtNodGRP1D [Medicago truncatula]
MKTKLFVSACFYALLLIFLVAIMLSEGAILKGNEGKSNDGCGDGIEIHCRKGYVDGTIWDKDISITKGTGWQTTGRKGGGSGKGGKGGGGGYRIPIPGVGKGGGGK